MGVRYVALGSTVIAYAPSPVPVIGLFVIEFSAVVHSSIRCVLEVSDESNEDRKRPAIGFPGIMEKKMRDRQNNNIK